MPTRVAIGSVAIGGVVMGAAIDGGTDAVPSRMPNKTTDAARHSVVPSTQSSVLASISPRATSASISARVNGPVTSPSRGER